MAQTVANLVQVLKESWTSERLEKQFLDEHPFLDKITGGSFPVTQTRIGEKAIVPIHKGRSGGYTSTSSSGGALNPADAQKVDSAEYTLPYHWFQIAIETGVLNQATGGAGSVVAGKDLEIEGALSDILNQNMRQIATNSDGVLAAAGATTTSATVVLAADGTGVGQYGNQAITRGWLYAGLKVDIGTLADTDAVVAGATIQSVNNDNPAIPTITIDSSVSTTSGTHYVFIANPNSTTAANPELNGLRNMVGSATTSLGGINPATAGEEFWKPAFVDNSTTTFSLDLALKLQRLAGMRGGKNGYVLTSLLQQANFYSLLQNQVRFQGETKMGAGNVDQTTWNQMEINALPEILDSDFYYLHLEDFVRVTGEGITKPTWVSELQGTNKAMNWVPNTTGFGDAIVFPWNLGMKRRNRSAAAIALT